MVENASAARPSLILATVPDRLHAFFTERPAAALVSSAACGADLVALEVAGLDVGWCCPSRQSAFGKPRWLTGRESGDRSTTVSSMQIRGAGGFVVLEHTSDAEAAYEAANARILDEALALAGTSPVGAPVASSKSCGCLKLDTLHDAGPCGVRTWFETSAWTILGVLRQAAEPMTSGHTFGYVH